MAVAEEDLTAHVEGRSPVEGETLTYVARPRSITAAARRIDPGNREDLAWVPKRSEKWQDEAWAYVDSVPELKFASGFNGNALSRLRIYPAVIIDPDQPPVAIQDAIGSGGVTSKLAADAADETARMEQSDGGIQGLLADFGTILSVSGDSYAVATPETPIEEEQWNVYSESAVTKIDKGLALRQKPGSKPEPFPPGTLFIRIWRRHKRWPGLADSNMRAILSESEELLIYSRQFRTVGRSRNNAGLLYLSNKLDLPPQIDPTTGKPKELTTMEQSLMSSMITPTHDDGSASGVVPHILRGEGKPDELIKHFPLDRKIDESAIARVTFLIQRLAHGLDTPVEVLTGVADVNHWSAWQIEDQSYKMHLQPLAQVPAAGLAKGFLRPALIIRGNPDDVVQRVVYALDASSLVVRPNRAADAKDAFDRLAISWDSFRDYLGFDEGDKPTDEEIAQRALMGLGDFHRTSIGQPGEAIPGLPGGGDSASGGGDAQARFRIAQALGLIPADATPPERERIAITASARDTTPARPPVDVGRRLVDIELKLINRLQASASESMRTALRIAGNRLKARAQGNPVLKRQVNRVDAQRVAAVLGTDQATAAVGGDLTTLLDGQFDDVCDEYDTWTRTAQNHVVALIRRVAPDDETADTAVARYQRNQDANRDAGKAALAAALLVYGTTRLFTPDATPDVGEFDSRLSVPAGLIREALALAGGSTSPGRGPTQNPGDLDWGIAGGVALGPDAQEAIAATGLEYDSMVWQVGWPERPFEPHQDLDGVVVTGFDDEVLGFDGWPASDSGGLLFPGDHDGCQCVLMPIYVESGDAASGD